MSGLFVKGRLSLAAACLCVVSAAGASAQTVIATIPVEGPAGRGVSDPYAKRAYIPTDGNGTNGQVTVIDETTNTIAGYITLNTNWPALTAALNPKTGLLYVGAETGGLFVINPKTGATVAYINVNAASVALNPFTNKIYASDFENYLYVIDGASNNIEASIPVNAIQNISVNPANNRIYAALQYFNPGAVAVIDGNSNKIIAQPPAGSGLSFDVVVDPFRNNFYSAEQFGTATVYNGKTNKQTTAIQIAGQPTGIVDDPITNTVYVANYQTGAVDIISGRTNTVTGSVAVGPQPTYMTGDPVNKLLYVGLQGTDSNGYPVYYVSVVKTQ
jgi:DNA-binding beta-propeller fold protein YncE